MKLEGSLDAFSLPDVFQLLSFTKKSGGLHLAHDGSDGSSSLPAVRSAAPPRTARGSRLRAAWWAAAP